MVRPSVAIGPYGIRIPRCAVCGKPLGTLDAAVGTHCRTLECRTIAAIRYDDSRGNPLHPQSWGDNDEPADAPEGESELAAQPPTERSEG